MNLDRSKKQAIEVLLARLRKILFDETLAEKTGSVKKRSGAERKLLAVDLLLSSVKERLLEHPELLAELLGSELQVPVSAFRRELGMQESVCVYLKDEQGLSFSELAALLHRDYKTVWTAYRKGKEKVKRGR